MDRSGARLLVAALLVVGLVELLAVHRAASWERAAATFWAALVGGPAFLVLLQPRLARDPRRGWRVAAALAPVLGIGAAAAELLKLLLGARWGAADPARSLIALYAGLTAMCVLASVHAWRVGPEGSLQRSLRFLPVILVGLLPSGENLLMLGLLLIEAGALLERLGFSRSLRAWASAAALGVLTLAAGALAVVAVLPSVPPGAGGPLDALRPVSVSGPLLVAALLVSAAVLAGQGRGDGPAPAPDPAA